MSETLYRFFAEGGDLLYIGITKNPLSRFEDHSGSKAWWSEVFLITVEHFDSRKDVEAAEKAAIMAEAPRYNIRHNSKSIGGAAPGKDRCVGRKRDGDRCRAWSRPKGRTCPSHIAQEPGPQVATAPPDPKNEPPLDEDAQKRYWNLAKAALDADDPMLRLMVLFEECFSASGVRRYDLKETAGMEPIPFAKALNTLLCAGLLVDVGTRQGPYYTMVGAA